jgi:hypothetical protein
MKNNLGKLYLLLLFPFFLFANSNLATYTLTANKKDIVEKEAVEVTFTATQKDHTDAMFFFLEPKQSDDYKIELLTHETKKISYHNYSSTFKYLLFPLKSGDIRVNFDFVIKTASDDEIAQIYVGDYSRIKWEDMSSGTKLQITPLALHVSPLNEKVDLVGDFTLDSKLQKNDINKYGTANLLYTLSGVGYDNKILQPLAKIPNVTSFFEVTDTKQKATSNGYEFQREYTYALTSKNNFTIPSIELKAYSPKKQKYYTLKSPSYTIKVSSIDPSTLVDKKEFPADKTYNFESLKNILIALLIFLAGFTTAKIGPSLTFKRIKKQKFQDIKESKTPKELILILLQNYKNRSVNKYINELELLEYKKSSKNFQQIKSDILKNIM